MVESSESRHTSRTLSLRRMLSRRWTFSRQQRSLVLRWKPSGGPRSKCFTLCLLPPASSRGRSHEKAPTGTLSGWQSRDRFVRRAKLLRVVIDLLTELPNVRLWPSLGYYCQLSSRRASMNGSIERTSLSTHPLPLIGLISAHRADPPLVGQEATSNSRWTSAIVGSAGRPASLPRCWIL